MDWHELILYILESLAGIAITGLSALVSVWIAKHVKSDTAKQRALELNSLVTKAVLSVKQTYVDALKGTSEWNKATQQEALSKALASIQGSMSADLKKWVYDTYGDVSKYLTTLIEAEIAVDKSSK